MRYNKRKWMMAAFKVGTGPKLSYFLRVSDGVQLRLGGRLKLYPDDGITKPDYQNPVSVLIDDVRHLPTGETMYVAAMF